MKTNYNEQLNKAGDARFLMRKNISKAGNIKAAFVYVPNDEKARAIASKCDSQYIPSVDSYIVIRNDSIIMQIEKSGAIKTGDFSTLTGRGKRLYEKHIEGAVDYLRAFHNVDAQPATIDSHMQVMRDCFQGAGAVALTIDDLLGL